MLANLEAALNQRYENRQIDAPGNADETGISEVVRLLLREQLSGAKPPVNLSMVMDLWRPWIHSRASDLLQELEGSLYDQAQFAELSRCLIGALETDLATQHPIKMTTLIMMIIRMIAVTAKASRTANNQPLAKTKAMVMIVRQ